MVAALFVRPDGPYPLLANVDSWTAERNALTWPGGCPVVAHPPCRAWSRLRGLANPLPGERELALWAVDQVRRFGGVLEHPAWSKLWEAADLPRPGERDCFGWTISLSQKWFGHRAEKPTWLYIVGVDPADLPPFPLTLGAAPMVCGTPGRSHGKRLHKGDQGWRPELPKRERELTPPAMASWLIDVARRSGVRAA